MTVVITPRYLISSAKGRSSASSMGSFSIPGSSRAPFPPPRPQQLGGGGNAGGRGLPGGGKLVALARANFLLPRVVLSFCLCVSVSPHATLHEVDLSEFSSPRQIQTAPSRSNQGTAPAWPPEPARQVPRQSRGVGTPTPHVSGEPPRRPPRHDPQRLRMRGPNADARGLRPERGARARAPAPPSGAPGRRRPTHRARRWAGPRGRGRGRRLRLGSAAASRPATSPQGRRPARGSEPRGGGGGLASMARGSG